MIREIDADTIHSEIHGVRVSFIGGYLYPLVGRPVEAGRLRLASLMDVGLMKLLSITHRATWRDYVDLAVLVRDHIPLEKLLKRAPRKYGRRFNRMIPLRALVTFEDISKDKERPRLLDKRLESSWQRILEEEVKKTAG